MGKIFCAVYDKWKMDFTVIKRNCFTISPVFLGHVSVGHRHKTFMALSSVINHT